MVSLGSLYFWIWGYGTVPHSVIEGGTYVCWYIDVTNQGHYTWPSLLHTIIVEVNLEGWGGGGGVTSPFRVSTTAMTLGSVASWLNMTLAESDQPQSQPNWKLYRARTKCARWIALEVQHSAGIASCVNTAATCLRSEECCKWNGQQEMTIPNRWK